MCVVVARNLPIISAEQLKRKERVDDELASKLGREAGREGVSSHARQILLKKTEEYMDVRFN